MKRKQLSPRNVFLGAAVLTAAILTALVLASCASTPATPVAVAHPYEDFSWKTDLPLASESGDGLFTGIFMENGTSGSITALEQKLGRKFAMVMWFADFSQDFPTAEAEKVWASGSVPNITWEPWFWSDKEKIHLKDINNGTWDQYISAWGKQAAAFGKPVMVRWGHEFNGDWYPWAVSKNGENAKAYVQAYRRVHDLVEKAGAANVVWVWCPNESSFPPKPWNNPLLAYPGDDVVDWVALDGYDFDGNASFSDLFTRVYAEVVRSVPKPIYIGETATGRKGADKAEWIQAMHEKLVTQFPAIKGLVWFNINKERDWRLDATADSLKAASEVFQLPSYRSRPEAIPELAAVFDHNLQEYRDAAKSLVLVDRNQLSAVKMVQGADGTWDWSKAKALSIRGAKDLDGTVKVGWSDAFLHILVEVKKPFAQTNKQDKDGIWNGDCLEFCISTNPAADPNRGYFDSTDWQMGFTPGDLVKALPPRTWEWSKLKSAVPGAVVTSAAIDGGYRMEVRVPWESLKGFKPALGMKLGFDLAVDGAGAEGVRSVQWIWNGNNQFYNSPVQWGTLVISE